MKRRKLKRHQRQALSFIKKHRGIAGLFLAPGTGKTLTALRYGERFKRMLVICRSDDFQTWQDEIEMEQWGRPIIEVDSKKDIERLLDTKADWWVESFVLMITYDLVKLPLTRVLFYACDFDLCATDESHYIKRWKSERTKKVIAATRMIPRRLALTGSPITNKPIDIFSQAYFIDDGETFGQNEYKFKKRWYLKSGPGWYLKRGAKDRIAKLMKLFSVHVHEDDVLTLPPKRYVKEHCIMSGMQKRRFKQVLNEWEIETKNGPLEIDYVIVQIAKLRQISSGFYYDENKQAVWMKSGKLKKLEDILTSEDYLAHTPKVVIWCAHTAEIIKIGQMARRLQIRSVKFFGPNKRLRNMARKKFKNDPSIKLFIGQVDSGVGINELTVASDAIYFSNSRKVVSRQQSERRNRRIGSEKHKRITYWDLISKGSLDEAILQSIKNDMDVAEYILKEIKMRPSIKNLVK